MVVVITQYHSYLFCGTFLLILFPSLLFAGLENELHQGDQVAQALLDKVENNKKQGGDHPFYKGIPSESSLSSSELRGRAQDLSSKDPTSQMVFESSGNRSQFKIDPQKDGLVSESKPITDNALKLIGGKDAKLTRTEHSGKDETLICEEAGDDSLETCTKELLVKVVKTVIQKEWKGQFHFLKEHGQVNLACPSLRQAVFSLRKNNSGDITSSYLACIQELKNKPKKREMTLPELDFESIRIKHVFVKKVPLKNGKTRFDTRGQSWTTNNGSTSYNYWPQIRIIYEEDSYKVLPDEWSSNCSRLETRVDQGLCAYDSKVCSQGKQTRIIAGVPVTRNCWQETNTYSCSYPAKNDCGPLRARGCTQINSACKQKVGDRCVVYSQTYQCRENTLLSSTESITGKDIPFCLDGNCREQSWEVNEEMMESLAQLSLLKEMQGQIQNGTLFRGFDNRCSKCIVSFKDCCGSGKGWGKDLGLTDCSSEEKALQQKRADNLCHYVGTYCAEKVLGVCLKKKDTYCCFGSKLLKAFHEQGRPQIGLGWGDPKEPLCRGFTVEEIQNIDFSKLDLREVYEDLMKNFSPNKINNVGKTVGDRINIIKKSLDPKKKQQSTQRDEG